MPRGWLPTKWALLIVVSLLQESSTFLILPRDIYWLSQRTSPGHATRHRSLQSKVNSPPSRLDTPPMYTPPRHNSLPPVRPAPKIFARSALPSQPFSPWGGKRGGGGGGSTRPFMNDGYFSPWRGKRSTYTSRRGQDAGTVTEHEAKRVMAGDPRTPAPGLDPVKVESPEGSHLPSDAHEKLKKSLEWPSNSMQSPPASFGSLEQSYVSFADFGFNSPLPSPAGKLQEHLETFGEAVQASSSKKPVNALAKNNKQSFDVHLLRNFDPGEMVSGLQDTDDKLKLKVDGMTTMAGADHEGEHKQVQMSNIEVGKTRAGVQLDDVTSDSKEMKSGGHRTVTPYHSELFPAKDKADFSDSGLHGKIVSDHDWHHLLSLYGLGTVEQTTTPTHMAEDLDMRSRMYDHSQPGVGPLFWVVNDEDGYTFPHGTETTETINSFLQNDGFPLKQQPPGIYSHKGLDHITKQEDINDSFRVQRHTNTHSITNAPNLKEATTTKHGSAPQTSEAELHSRLAENEQRTGDFSPQELRSERTSESGHETGKSRSAKHWEPVFRNPFAAERRLSLPLSVSSPFQAAKGPETSPSQRLSVPHSTALQSHRGSSSFQPVGEMSALRPASVSTLSHKENLAQNRSDDVNTTTLSRQQIANEPNGKAPDRPQSPQIRSNKTASKDASLDELTNQVMREDENRLTANSETLNGTLSSIRNLNLGALPFANPSVKADLEMPLEGAGLMGSNVDVVEDTPEGKRVIKYQELAALSSQGGITLTADNQGQLKITVDNFQDNAPGSGTKDPSLSDKQYHQNYTDARNHQSPDFFKPRNVTLNMTEHDSAVNESVRDTGFNQNKNDSDILQKTSSTLSQVDPKLFRFNSNAVASYPIGQKLHKSNCTNPIQSKSDSNKSDTTDTNALNESEPDRHTATHHDAGRSSQHEETPILLKANKHHTSILIPRNRILNPRRALRAYSFFKHFPVRARSSNDSSSRSKTTGSVEGKIPPKRFGRGQLALTRNRREAGNDKQKTSPARELPYQFRNLSKRTLANKRKMFQIRFSKQNLANGKNEHRNNSLPLIQAHKHTLKGQSQSKQDLNSEITMSTKNESRNIEKSKQIASAVDLKGNETGTDTGKEDYPSGHKSENLPQKRKRFLTRGKEQTALRQMRRFYLNYYPRRGLHSSAKSHKNPVENHMGFHRRPPMKQKWLQQSTRHHPPLQSYIISNGRTFKPNWYFKNAKPARDDKDDSRKSSKPKLQTRRPATPKPTDEVQMKDAANSFNVLPVSNKTSARSPFSLLTGMMNGQPSAVSTGHILHNLNELFRISLNIQFQGFGSSPASQDQLTSENVSRRRRRSGKVWPERRYETYFLFPLGNIGWITFPYHPYYMTRRPAVMAKYKLG